MAQSRGTYLVWPLGNRTLGFNRRSLADTQIGAEPSAQPQRLQRKDLNLRAHPWHVCGPVDIAGYRQLCDDWMAQLMPSSLGREQPGLEKVRKEPFDWNQPQAPIPSMLSVRCLLLQVDVGTPLASSVEQ